MIRLESRSNSTIISVRAQPGANRTGILGEHDEALRIAVSAAPEKGKANKAIVKVLADAFEIPKSSVELISGTTARNKKFLLSGKSVAMVKKALERLLGDAAL